MPIKNNNNSK